LLKSLKLTANEINKELSELKIKASQRTVRRMLHAQNIYGRKSVKKPLVSEINRKKRLFGAMQEKIGSTNGIKSYLVMRVDLNCSKMIQIIGSGGCQGRNIIKNI